jgi:hypothetical protein
MGVAWVGILPLSGGSVASLLAAKLYQETMIGITSSVISYQLRDETCLNQTLGKPKTCLNQTLGKPKTCLNQTLGHGFLIELCC